MPAKTFNFTDGVTHTLTASSGTTYGISDSYAGGWAPTSGTFNFTGSYVVTGPTQVSTGTFSVPASRNNYEMLPLVLNTSNYPTQLGISRSNPSNFLGYLDMLSGSSEHLTPTTNDNYFVNTIVDGSQITWGFWRVGFDAQYGALTPGSLATSAIPEPSTYAAIFGLTVLGFAAYRGRKCHQR